MDDINFDELDKAVNSAMQPQPTSDVPTTQPAEPVSTDAAQPASTTSSPAAVIPPKRRGQFMDMVHPSSDMRTAAPKAPLTNRQAPSITPLNPSIVETTQDDMALPTAAPEADMPATDMNEPVSSVHDHAWPDPIDIAEPPQPASAADMATVENSFVDALPPQPATNDETIESKPQAEESASSEPSQEVSPLQSPFIEGAEVEKRPLGGFTPVLQETDGTSVVEESIATSPEAALSETPIEMSEPAADTAMSEGSAADEHVALEAREPLHDEPVEPIAVSSETPDTQAAAENHAEAGTAQSIPQQYHPEELGHNDETIQETTVFDTQPLPVPEKSHGSHKVVFYLFLAVLMLAIGAAAGYIIFVLKLF